MSIDYEILMQQAKDEAESKSKRFEEGGNGHDQERGPSIDPSIDLDLISQIEIMQNIT